MCAHRVISTVTRELAESTRDNAHAFVRNDSGSAPGNRLSRGRPEASSCRTLADSASELLAGTHFICATKLSALLGCCQQIVPRCYCWRHACDRGPPLRYFFSPLNPLLLSPCMVLGKWVLLINSSARRDIPFRVECLSKLANDYASPQRRQYSSFALQHFVFVCLSASHARHLILSLSVQ